MKVIVIAAFLSASVAAAAAACSAPGNRPPADSPAPPTQGPVADEARGTGPDPATARSDSATWLEKLERFETMAELDEAVAELVAIGDPRAIEPLTIAWRRLDRSSAILRAIVALAERESFRGEVGPFWPAAMPALADAVNRYDLDVRSLAEAVFAADAVGRARQPESVPILVAAATIKSPRLSPVQNLRIAAVRALGSFPDSQMAVDTLIDILATDVGLQIPQLNAAAANALAEVADPAALQPLLVALFAVPVIHAQVRRAITRLGPIAIPELIKIFTGKHAAINRLAKREGFNDRCGQATKLTTCRGPGVLRFKSAALLGDLVAVDAGPILLAALATPAAPSFFDPSGLDGPSDHRAILEALRNIGDKRSSSGLLRYARAAKTGEIERAAALDAYSVVAPRGSSLALLREIWSGTFRGKPLVDDGLRNVALFAYTALADKSADLAVLDKLERESAKAVDDNAGISAETIAVFATRVRVAIHCQSKPSCYAGLLALKPDALFSKLGVKAATLSAEQKEEHRTAVIGRALLELAKLGPAAAAKEALPAMLALADSRVAVIRRSLLRALPRVAGASCQPCRERLAEVIASQSSDDSLTWLTADTRVVYHYFLAGEPAASKQD